MWHKQIVFILCTILHATYVQSIWQCTQNADCSSIAGSYCSSGQCVCPPGQQTGQAGSVCLDVSPYFTSPCVEDNQCWRLLTHYECRKEDDAQEGSCHCKSGFHYLSGRCWESRLFSESCSRDEECTSAVRDPFSMRCAGAGCECSDGYYLRQRGECRKIGYVVGDACVVNEDCQFNDGVCDNFRCVSSTQALSDITVAEWVVRNNVTTRALSRQQGTPCDVSTPCTTPFTCNTGVCVCPVGYYASDDGTFCLANLGSPSTEEQCVGFLAEVRDGLCVCPPNFFYEENMRDCVKVARTLTDSCVSDEMCHTFGAASRCSEPVLPWLLRQCECVPELAVWDQQRTMCRLFAGIGESCTTNSDCLAGDMEAVCVSSTEGEGLCACPEGFVDFQGLCLTSGLELGDTCQSSLECTGTENTACESGRCTCANGYQESEGSCAPTLGGSCAVDTDCTIGNSVCVTEDDRSTCQCGVNFVQDSDLCWPALPGSAELEQVECVVSAQCVALAGASTCEEGRCVCAAGHHYRDGGCWTITGLFESCSRTSECYLSDASERVLCRNSLCQCSFDYPYSEELNTCTSSAAVISSGVFSVLLAVSVSVIMTL